MYYSPHDADDAFQAVLRAERWRSAAIAAAGTTADATPAHPESRSANTSIDADRSLIRPTQQRPKPRYG
jgi:hypothetical protein